MESVPGIFHDKLKEGQNALKKTEWTQARDCFQSVVREEEIPEAFELLGRAAWWLDTDKLLLVIESVRVFGFKDCECLLKLYSLTQKQRRKNIHDL